MVAMSFPADGRVLNFIGAGDEACLHCIDSTLLSGSQWWTHVSSPVIICRTNLSRSDSKRSTNSWDVVTRRTRSWSVRFLGTHLVDTFRWMIMDYGFHASTWNLHCSRDIQYFYSPVISDQFLHSCNYRRPAGPRVIFERLTSTPKLSWPSGNCAVRRRTVPVHGTQSIINFFAARPSLQRNLMTARNSNFKFSITTLSSWLCRAMTSSPVMTSH